MIANPKKMPLSLAKDLQRLLLEIKKVTLSQSDIVEEIVTDKAIYTAKDRDVESDFNFRVMEVYQDHDLKSMFKIFVKPYSAASLGHMFYEANYRDVFIYYNRWLDVIREYGAISFTQEEEFIHKYTDEFYDYFQIVDEDAGTAPLEPHKQVSVVYLLDSIKNVLSLQPPSVEIDGLIEEAQNIKDEVSGLTKKTLGKRVASLMAKIWSKRAELGKKVIDTTSKEIMKRTVNYALDNWDDLLLFFSKFFN